MLAKIFSRAQAGVDAPAVTVEVHQSNGLPALNIVGLPEAAVRESKGPRHLAGGRTGSAPWAHAAGTQ